MDEVWTVGDRESFSKSKWSPFAGKKIKGKVRRVVIRGELAFVDDQVLVSPGSGLEVTLSRPSIRPRTMTNTGTLPVVSSSLKMDEVVKSDLLDVLLFDEEPITPKVMMDNKLSLALQTTRGKERSESLSFSEAAPKETRAIYQQMFTALGTKEPDMSLSKPLSILDVDTHHVSKISAEILSPGSSISRHLLHLKGCNILSVRQFNKDLLSSLFSLAQVFKRSQSVDHVLRGKVMGSVFYEPSTRTSCSFSAAMYRLGGQVVHVPEMSSLKKGESDDDTIATLAAYSDCLVVRHPKPGEVERLSNLPSVTGKPVINGGDGIGEHPTQALLDIFTIREEIGTVNGLTIALVGDLKHGRTVHSLARLLTLYQIQKLLLVSPQSLKMPDDVKEFLDKKRIKWTEFVDLEEALKDCHVLYMTRIQKERFASEEEYERLMSSKSYRVTPELMANAKSVKAVLHPLPRLQEIRSVKLCSRLFILPIEYMSLEISFSNLFSLLSEQHWLWHWS